MAKIFCILQNVFLIWQINRILQKFIGFTMDLPYAELHPASCAKRRENAPRVVKGNRDKQAPRLYYTAMDITLPAPKTLQEWRSQELKLHLGGSYPRNVWTPLESFFLSQGYILWQSPSSLYQRPPNDAPRAPDGFAYKTVYCEIEPKLSRHFDMIVSKTSTLLHSSDTLSRALFTVQRARLTIATF